MEENIYTKLLTIEGFKGELITKPEEMMLNLVFSDNPTQEALNEFLEAWDIEIAGGHKALLLAYFMKMHPELNYPEYVHPRLKGLLNYYRFQNMKLMSHFCKICNCFKQNGINDILILKGGAMKHLRPDLPRVMGDIDILVHEEDFEKAGKLAESMGYGADWQLHSIDLHPKGTEEGLLDIHKYIDFGTGCQEELNNNLFKRATLQKVFNVDVLVPSCEDLVFISIVNMVKNLSAKTSISGTLYSLFDCKYLLDSKEDFNWDIVIQNAIDSKTEYKLYFGINFINNIVPNLLPDKIKKNKKFEKKFKDFCLLLYYKRFYLGEMREHSHALKIQDAIKSWDLIKEYMSFKPKYFILKRSIISKNPFIAKKILQIEKRFVCK